MYNSSKAIRRFLVRARISPYTVPLFFLFIWSLFVFGLARVADSWIVILAASPIVFAAFITFYVSGLIVRIFMADSAALMLPGDAFDTHSSQIIGRRVAGRSTALGFASQLRSSEDLKVVTFSTDERNLLDDLVKPLLKPGSNLTYHSLIPRFFHLLVVFICRILVCLDGIF